MKFPQSTLAFSLTSFIAVPCNLHLLVANTVYYTHGNVAALSFLPFSGHCPKKLSHSIDGLFLISQAHSEHFAHHQTCQ